MKNSALIMELSEELSKIWHNATLKSELKIDSDYEQDLFDSQFELEKQSAIEQVIEEDIFKGLPFRSNIYQYGRSGATLAPEGLIRQYGGSSYGIFKADDLVVEYNLSTKDTRKLLKALKEFNTRVRAWCSSAPDECLKYLREECAEDLAANKGKKRKTKIIYE